MFICNRCGWSSGSGQPAKRVVTEIRTRVYPRRPATTRRAVDEGGTGTEIVHEVNLCPRCTNEQATYPERFPVRHSS